MSRSNSMRWALCGLAMVILLAPAACGEDKRPQRELITPGKFHEGADIFRHDLPVKHSGPLAECKVCGKPLAHHTNPNFVCSSRSGKRVTVDQRKATCPVCTHAFAAFVPDADSRKNMDTDFCRHPAGAAALASEVWLCASCGYAALYWEFNDPVRDHIKDYVSETITPGTKKQFGEMVGLKPKSFTFDDFSFLPQAKIPEAMKYENALAIYHIKNAKPGLLAKLHLGAAHACRRALNRPVALAELNRSIRRVNSLLIDQLSDVDDPLTMAKIYRKALARASSKDEDSKLSLTSLDKLYILIRLAGLHDRLGESWWSMRFLVEAGKIAAAQKRDATRGALMNLVNARKNVMTRETQHIASSVGQLRRALTSTEEQQRELISSVYLMGELQARLGLAGKAVPWLETARQTASTHAGLKGPLGSTLKLINVWSANRLASPVFFQGEMSAANRIGPDKSELELVKKVVGVATDQQPVAPPNMPPADDGTAHVETDPPPTDPTLPAKKTVGTATCREQMRLIWAAVKSYRDSHQELFPASAAVLIKSGALTQDHFRCPETGRDLFYRKPRADANKDFMLFHSDPKACTCKLMMYSDGSISEFGK